jgi:ribulose-phosphate 3-epimerase
MKKISVSILSSKNLEEDIERINFSNADLIHVDVADGKFVKNKNNPYKTILKMSKNLHKRLDVHLMENKPLKNINTYATLNTESITVHVELKEPLKYLELIKKYGIKCGLAINPDTDIMTLKPYMDIVDLIIVMGVYPGYGGQPFIPETTKKIIKIKKMIVTSGRDIKITVDGGVNEETSKGLDFADILVSGSYVLNGEDVSERCDILRNNANKLKKKEKREE